MKKTTRREALKQLATGTIAASSISGLSSYTSHPDDTFRMKGNINHSVCRWTFNFLSVDELCKTVKKIGFQAIDLVGPKDWPTLKQNGIFSSMCNGAEISLTEGWNDKQYHATLIKNYTEYIDLVAKAGYKNLICFSGNRKGMDDQVGLANCAEGLKKIMSIAEQKGVIIQMELLNSKVNHKDYMCDKSKWGVELCKRNMIFVGAVIFGMGVCYFWPTMLGFVSEYMPKTGAVGINLMGGAGMFAVSVYMMFMGGQYDKMIAKKLPPGADIKIYNSPNATAEMKTALAEANRAAGPEVINTTLIIPILLVIAFAGLCIYMRNKKKMVLQASAV